MPSKRHKQKREDEDAMGRLPPRRKSTSKASPNASQTTPGPSGATASPSKSPKSKKSPSKLDSSTPKAPSKHTDVTSLKKERLSPERQRKESPKSKKRKFDHNEDTELSFESDTQTFGDTSMDGDTDSRSAHDPDQDDNDYIQEQDDTSEQKSGNLKNCSEDFSLGMNIFATMPESDVNKMLSRIEKLTTPFDNIACTRREARLDWKKISFGAYDADYCQAVWKFLRSQTRKYRIMSEVVEEIKMKYGQDKSYRLRLVENIKGYPVKPQEAIGGFHYYNREEWEKLKASSTKSLPNFVKFQRECRRKYDALPKHARQRYEDLSSECLAKYTKQVKEFYARNPGLEAYVANEVARNRIPAPSQPIKSKALKTQPVDHEIDPFDDAPVAPCTAVSAFIQSKLNRLDPPPMAEEITQLKHKFLAKWNKMPQEKKLKWIDRTIKNCMHYLQDVKEYQEKHPGYIEPALKIQQIVKSEDYALWERANGKPPNPKPCVYDLFYEEFCKIQENAELPDEERRRAAHAEWKRFDWYNKEMFSLKYKAGLVTYRKELHAFFHSLPDFLKPVSLKRIPKRYWKMLEEVERHPPDADPLAILGVEESEDTSPKKSKKTKHNNETIEEDPEDPVTNEFADEYILPDNYPDQHEEIQENLDVSPKRKKKKKKNIPESDLRDKRITEDKKRLLLAKEQHRKLSNSSKKPEYSTSYWDSESKASKATSLSRNDIFEVIRGIFDARGHLGRKFSVYYYYAKYVASDIYWINKLATEDIKTVALNMVKCYHELPASQKVYFIKKYVKWSEEGRFKLAGPDLSLYPGEPEPPPRKAYILYKMDMRKAGKEVKNWVALPENTQKVYIKKLYDMTEEYLQQFEQFVNVLTPSDFVHYAVFRAEAWEKNMYTTQVLEYASREFIFPIPIKSGVGESQLTAKEGGYTPTVNPYLRNDQLISSVIAEKRMRRKRRDSDDPSSGDELGFSLMFEDSEYIRRRKHFRKRLKRLAQYQYPLEDLLSNVGTAKGELVIKV